MVPGNLTGGSYYTGLAALLHRNIQYPFRMVDKPNVGRTLADEEYTPVVLRILPLCFKKRPKNKKREARAVSRFFILV